MYFDQWIIFGGALAASVASGTTGFAFAIIGMAIWLHVMPAARAVPLVVVSSIILNLAFVWQLKSDVQLRRLAPFLIGALIGVPLGIAALRVLDPNVTRLIVGALLIGYSLYMLTRVQMPVLKLGNAQGRTLDGAVGMLGGFMGGSTSLNGLFPTIWTGLRGWSKRQQRGVFQPYILLVHIYTLIWLGGVGGIGRQTFMDLLLCLPALAIGGYVGMKVFHSSSEKTFRKLMLLLFFVSGVALCV